MAAETPPAAICDDCGHLARRPRVLTDDQEVEFAKQIERTLKEAT